MPLTSRAWFRDWIPNAFGIDLRSLALFRILLGVLLLVDLVWRATDLTVFYADSGAFPVASYQDYHSNRPGTWSLHALGGSAPYEAILFLIAGTAAFSMMIGYRTKLSAVISFVLLISIHARNPLVLNGGDVLLRVTHFWILFLPIGARWSLDARRRRDDQTGDHFVSVGSAALLLQIAMVYWFGAALKTDIETTFSGYEGTEAVCEIAALFKDGAAVHSLTAGEDGNVSAVQ